MIRTQGPAEELERTWELCQRIDLNPEKSRRERGLLAPIAHLLGADTAVFRVFRPGSPKPISVDGFEIPDRVHDAYMDRYFEVDPILSLVASRFTAPVFAHQVRSEQIPRQHASRYDKRFGEPDTTTIDFARYRREFLVPNGFYHHIGFRFQTVSCDRTFALDFHRPRHSCPFDRLQVARAQIVAMLLHARAGQLSATCAHDIGAQGAPHVDDNARPNGPGDDAGAAADLSPREFEVARTVALGLTNKQVASSLGISVRTVENHLRSIFAKLEIRTRTHLVAWLRASEPKPAIRHSAE